MILAVEAHGASEVEDRSKSAYFSRKDVRTLSVVFILLFLITIPIYSVFKADRDKHVCYTNLSQIYKAIGIYMEANNDRYPPAFVVGENGEPQLFDGHPYTWTSLVHPGMNTRSSFECPSATSEENVLNLHPDAGKPPFASSYGMYAPWSAWSSGMVANPNMSVLIAETSNHGAEDTYDPKPFTHGIDGVIIGWDNDNFKPNSLTQYVTRLAFPKSEKGNFSKDGPARHGGGIHFLYASGQIGFLGPPAARLQWFTTGGAKTELTGRWATR